MPETPPTPPRDPFRGVAPLMPARPAPRAADALPEPRWWSREGRRSLVSSLTLHGLLLLVMGLWYFVPRAVHPALIEGRLAGSEMSVEDGLTLTGGMNTPIELTQVPDPAPETVLASLERIDPAAETKGRPVPVLDRIQGAEKPSGGGGFENNNPGAGNNDGFGLARFGDGGELVQGVAVKVGDPQFTLIWDSQVDLDLHVVEPGGKEIYWEEPVGNRGGELDVDNTKGYGPENVYWLHQDEAGKKVKGAGPPGAYRWWVVYWGGFGGAARPTQWKVRIKHAGKLTVVSGKFKALNEKSRVYTLEVEPGPTVAGAVPAPAR
jgi:hypothetical protein